MIFVSAFGMCAVWNAVNRSPVVSEVPDDSDQVQPSQALVPAIGGDAAVVAAYRQIPHRQTRFDFRKYPTSEPRRIYLQRLVATLDQSVLWRVDSMRRINAGESSESIQQDANRILEFLRRCQPPAGFARYHELLTEAIQRQSQFLAESDPQSLRRAIDLGKRDRDLRAISSLLIRAHTELRGALGDLDRHNEDAVFDYHCALDFL
jgi:hypothetical protein